MFCRNCGWQNEEGSMFCEKCGQTLIAGTAIPQASVSQPVYIPPQSGYDFRTQAPFSSPYAPAAPVAQPPVVKKKTGLIIGLSVGGGLILVAVILIFALSGKSPLAGMWYNEDLGVALEFENGGIVVSHTPDGTDEGSYSFNSGSNKGIIEADEEKFGFQLDDRRIEVHDIGAFEKAGKSFDVEDFLDDYRDKNGS